MISVLAIAAYASLSEGEPGIAKFDRGQNDVRHLVIEFPADTFSTLEGRH